MNESPHIYDFLTNPERWQRFGSSYMVTNMGKSWWQWWKPDLCMTVPYKKTSGQGKGALINVHLDGKGRIREISTPDTFAHD